jgi:hypothetical protein
MTDEHEGSGCGFMISVVAVGVAVMLGIALWSRLVGR